jgi:hypothetical protein
MSKFENMEPPDYTPWGCNPINAVLILECCSMLTSYFFSGEFWKLEHSLLSVTVVSEISVTTLSE